MVHPNERDGCLRDVPQQHPLVVEPPATSLKSISNAKSLQRSLTALAARKRVVFLDRARDVLVL
eukprot:5936064-Prymnesium_polylepis.1